MTERAKIERTLKTTSPGTKTSSQESDDSERNETPQKATQPPEDKTFKPVSNWYKNKGTLKDAWMGETPSGTKANGLYTHRIRASAETKQEDALELTLA